MTSATLYRNLLALKMLPVSLAAYWYLLPRQYKITDFDSFMSLDWWLERAVCREALNVLMRSSAPIVKAGARIGDTIKVRKPARYRL